MSKKQKPIHIYHNDVIHHYYDPETGEYNGSVSLPEDPQQVVKSTRRPKHIWHDPSEYRPIFRVAPEDPTERYVKAPNHPATKESEIDKPMSVPSGMIPRDAKILHGHTADRVGI